MEKRNRISFSIVLSNTIHFYQSSTVEQVFRTSLKTDIQYFLHGSFTALIFIFSFVGEEMARLKFQIISRQQKNKS